MTEEYTKEDVEKSIMILSSYAEHMLYTHYDIEDNNKKINKDNRKISMDDRMNKIEEQNKEILTLLRPVHAHASFVDDLKHACYNNRLLKAFMPTKESEQLVIEYNSMYFDCNV